MPLNSERLRDTAAKLCAPQRFRSEQLGMKSSRDVGQVLSWVKEIRCSRREQNTTCETIRAIGTCVAVLGLMALTNCAFLSRHHFAIPGRDWRARSGQLMYRNGNVTVVGDVVVRFSKAGDFELTFSKGPGITLLTLQQDAAFAQVKSGLARLSWSGPTNNAPAQLRGWLSLRQMLLASPNERVVRHSVGTEKFVFRF
jgi:hypothetical protein